MELTRILNCGNQSSSSKSMVFVWKRIRLVFFIIPLVRRFFPGVVLGNSFQTRFKRTVAMALKSNGFCTTPLAARSTSILCNFNVGTFFSVKCLMAGGVVLLVMVPPLLSIGDADCCSNIRLVSSLTIREEQPRFCSLDFKADFVVGQECWDEVSEDSENFLNEERKQNL